MDKNFFCNLNEPIIKAMQLINSNKKGIVFIVGKNNKLLGVLSTGDIRRFLLKSYSFYERVENIMNEDFVYGTLDESREEWISKTSITDDISIIPIVDKYFKVVDVFEYKSKFHVPLSEPNFGEREFSYLIDAFLSTWISSSGKYIELFERKFSEIFDNYFAIPTTSGTAALHICLIESNVGYGDEVIVPTVTFIAPINTVKYVGAEPIFMDCDDYLNIDVKKVEQFCEKECDFNGEFLINKKTKKKIKAIIPVHVYGNLVDMEHLMEISEKYNLIVIEDATEALGSYFIAGKYKNRKAGTIGHFGCFSFNGNKIITTGGGGMVITNSKKNADHIKYLTTQAKDDPIYYIHNEIGYNFRMTNLTAALGVAQIENLLEFINEKRKNFNKYSYALKDKKGLKLIKEPEYSYSNYWFYSLLVDKDKYGTSRDELLLRFSDQKIQTRPIWYLNHLQKPYINNQTYKIEKALWYYDRIISIPCSSNLSVEEIEKVIKVLKK